MRWQKKTQQTEHDGGMPEFLRGSAGGTPAITGRQEKTMSSEKTTNAAPVHGIVRLPSPYYDEDGITIYCGDCLEILPFIESVDVTFSSPPYNTIAATAPSGMMAEHNHKQTK